MRKLLIIILAGLIGALMATGVMMVANVLSDMRHHRGQWTESLAWYLLIPTFIITSFTGRSPNPWVINALIGAVGFSLIAGCWQLMVRPVKRLSREAKSSETSH